MGYLISIESCFRIEARKRIEGEYQGTPAMERTPHVMQLEKHFGADKLSAGDWRRQSGAQLYRQQEASQKFFF